MLGALPSFQYTAPILTALGLFFSAFCASTITRSELRTSIEVPGHKSFSGQSLLTGQYDHAIEQCRKALELDPHYLPAQMYLGYFYVLTGKLDEGIKACETAALLWGRYPLSLAWLGAAYAWAGRIGEVKKLVEELQILPENVHVPGWALALIYSGLGEIDKALDGFENAIEEHDPVIAIYHIAPIFDSLRSHPRYHALLRKMNLAP